MKSEKIKLILASASPRRKELLAKCNVEFTVETADVRELDSGDDLEELPGKNAMLKAAQTAEKFPDALVLGADTMIIFDGRAIGKPENPEDAANMLKNFSGRTHSVITGMALVSKNRNICESWHCISEVLFRKLDAETIKEYLEKVYVLDKAGAYAIQEYGEMIVERFSGEIENITGLPLVKLQELLKKYLTADGSGES